jgi:hypothetical protein
MRKKDKVFLIFVAVLMGISTVLFLMESDECYHCEMYHENNKICFYSYDDILFINDTILLTNDMKLFKHEFKTDEIKCDKLIRTCGDSVSLTSAIQGKIIKQYYDRCK